MSLLWFDGFNGVPTAQLAVDYRDVAVGVTIGAGRDTTDGAVGAANSDSMIRDCAPTSAARGAIGLAMYVSAFPGAHRKVFTLLDATDTPIFTLMLRTDGHLDIVQGGSVVNPSYIASGLTVSTGDWIYVEVGFRLAATGGMLVIRVNGILHVQSAVIAFAPPLTWAAVQYHPDEGLDDLYVVDGAGSVNWLLTPQRVWTVAPATVGDLADWTSSSGVGQVEDIDESPHNSDTDYIWASADEAISTFIMAILPAVAPGPVYGVAMTFVSRDASLAPGDVGPVRVRPVMRTGGVTQSVPAASEGLVLTDTYAQGRYTWILNPATVAPWTHADLIGDLQFGVERHDS